MELNNLATTLISSLFSGFIAYIFGRKRAKIEDNKLQGDALQTTQIVYDKLVKDVNEKLSEMQNEIISLKSQISIMARELEECRKKTAAVTRKPKKRIID
jgi:hypothetical protein